MALGSILCLSAFLQFYRLDSLQSFHGDEGSLVLAARALVVQHQLPVYGLALAVGSAHQQDQSSRRASSSESSTLPALE